MQNQQDIKKDFIWNTIGSAIYALSSMVLAFFVLHFAGQDDGGIFSFGFSTLGHQLHLVACFGIRAYQITDMRREYSYDDYRRFRVYTSCIAVFMGLAYLGLMLFLDEYSLRKCFIIFMLVLYKICDAIGELYESETQRIGKLYIGGMELCIRTVLASGILILTLIISADVILSAVLSVCMQLVVLVIFRGYLNAGLLNNRKYLEGGRFARVGTKSLVAASSKDVSHLNQASMSDVSSPKDQKPYSAIDLSTLRSPETAGLGDQTVRLFKSTVLLFIIVFIDFYIFSSTRYAVDLYMTDAANGIYNVLFMPTSTIYLLANFVTRPFISRLSSRWLDKDKEGFRKESRKLVLLISGISGLCMLGVIFLGRPVLYILELLLGEDYSGLLTRHHFEFCLIILGGCGYALIYLFYYFLVIMRKQKLMFFVYLLVLVAAFLLSNFFVAGYGLMGASVAYCITMGLLTAALWIALRCVS